MSQPKIVLRALPNVDFVHDYPGIPANPERPQATIRGSLELRLGQQPVKAKWVKVELRKIETIPGQGNRNEEFIDIIGKGPLTLWGAQGENEPLTSRDIPFTIPIPENIPSSVALKNGHGIKYEVAAKLCMKGKKGIFRREASITISHSVSVVIDKHELHSTWPIYAQPESRQAARDDGLVLIVDRGNTCFGPGDRVVIIATLKTDNLTPIVVRGFEFYLVEIITFIAGHQPHGKHKGNGNVTPTITVIGEHKVPLSLTLYGGTQHKTELGCIVPPSHTTSSINTAHHVDVSYKMKVRVVLDHVAPVEMELPVTLTNWPRNVSAEIVRRIGTIPNLSPKIIPVARPIPTMNPIGHSYGPPLPPPTGALPSIPDVPPAVPPKPELSSAHRVVPLGGIVTPLAAPSHVPLPSSVGPSDVSQTLNEPSRAAAEFPISSHESSPVAIPNNGNGPDEFGHITPSGNTGQAATVPARIIRVPTQRASTADSESSGESEPRVFSSSGTISGRRNRAMSRLKVMNANEDIPEESSPTKHDGPSVSRGGESQMKGNGSVDSHSGSLSTSSRNWMSAEEEKKRLYDRAKAQVDKAHGRARSQDRTTDSGNEPSSGYSISPTVSQSASAGNITQHSTTSTLPTGSRASPVQKASSLPKSAWPTAEEEKRRLFEQAQAKVRQKQGLGPMSPVSPTFSPSPEPNGVHYDSSTVTVAKPAISGPGILDPHSTGSPYISSQKPAMSAGAALYSHAMASIARTNSATVNSRSQVSSQPKRNISATAGDATSQARQGSSSQPNGHGTNVAPSSAQQMSPGPPNANIPQEAPISYEELFGNRAPAASPPNEKELLRQKYDAEDAAARQAAAPVPPNQGIPFVHSQPPSQQPLSEKEIMRRAFEARDAALRAAGQTPPPIITPSSSSSTPVQSSLPRRPSTSTPTPPSLAPNYDTDIAPQWSSNRPLTAAEEKAQLAAQYGTPQSSLSTNLSATSSPDLYKSNLTRERSHRSDTSEVFLRRDPSISAGKKRASQMQSITPPPPPPLPPRPPQEYIEETKEEDRRTTLLSSLPLDFSSPFDVGFGPMAESPTSSNHNRV